MSMLELPKVYSESTMVMKTYSGYNPPKFVTDAAKEALDKVECNQYSPTKVGYLMKDLQWIPSTDGVPGTTTAQESTGGCIFTILWEEAKSRHRSHYHNRGK